ncbi:uncharacterized protein LOC131207647 [Anopheles bellator]|uniref:uncharacterized protein LOC131207647 n=1 Tax=Anopheles bellator TaxID=139047 RepID=UPI0026490BA8|nr:uncharacterized protein LOC131207647 [Anopheles bellator]
MLHQCSIYVNRAQHSTAITACVIILIFVPICTGLPLWNFFNRTDGLADIPESGVVSSKVLDDSDDLKPLLRYDTVVPILQVIFTPIGRMVWPRVEQWFSEIFGAYLDSANRAIENMAQFATDNISFQKGDTYYAKSDMIDGHGHQSLIVTLPSGRTITVLTFKTKSKFNVFEEFPQLSESQNEVRKLD